MISLLSCGTITEKKELSFNPWYEGCKKDRLVYCNPLDQDIVWQRPVIECSDGSDRNKQIREKKYCEDRQIRYKEVSENFMQGLKEYREKKFKKIMKRFIKYKKERNVVQAIRCLRYMKMLHVNNSWITDELDGLISQTCREDFDVLSEKSSKLPFNFDYYEKELISNPNSGSVRCLARVILQNKESFIASGCHFGFIHFWGRDSKGKLVKVKQFQPHTSCVEKIIQGSDGRCLSLASDSSNFTKIQIWDPEDLTTSVLQPGGRVKDITLLRDGKTLVVGSHNLLVYSYPSLNPLYKLKSIEDVTTVIELYDGFVGCGTNSGEIHIFNPKSGKIFQSFKKLGKGIVKLLELKDHSFLVMCSDSSIRIYDRITERPLIRWRGRENLVSCIENRDGSILTLGYESDSSPLYVHNPRTGETTHHLQHNDSTYCALLVDKDIYIGGYNNIVVLKHVDV